MDSHPHGCRFFPAILIVLLLLISGCLLETSQQPPQPSQQATEQPIRKTSIPSIKPTVADATVPHPTLQPPTPVVNYGNDYRAIQLAWFYNSPSNSDLAAVAQTYSRFILTHGDENIRDTMKLAGIKTPILQYLYLAAIKNPGSCTSGPSPDQVATERGDYCQILQQHPDWFLKSASGEIIDKHNGSVLMDPSNQGWRDFWLQRARVFMEQYGWDGVFLDNVEASIYKPYEYGSDPDPSLTDASYVDMIEDNLRFLYTGYFHPNNRPLYANIIAVKDPSVWLRYMQYLDGAMLEDFAVGWNDEYRDPQEWQMQLDLAEKTQAMGKTIILVSQGEQSDTARQVFSLASYLLVNNGNAYFRYINGSSYNHNWYYDNYSYNLGVPLGPYQSDGQTWSRDFTNGQVWVNPYSHAAEINPK